MSREMAKTLAQMCLKAAELREASYDHDASNKATHEDQEKQRKNRAEGVETYSMLNYSSFYRLSLQDACLKVSPECGQLIYLALDGWWNDVAEWANDTLNKT